MTRTDAEYREILTKCGIGLPVGEIVEMSYYTRNDSWHVRTDVGWYWWDGKHWVRSLYGPTH